MKLITIRRRPKPASKPINMRAILDRALNRTQPPPELANFLATVRDEIGRAEHK